VLSFLIHGERSLRGCRRRSDDREEAEAQSFLPKLAQFEWRPMEAGNCSSVFFPNVGLPLGPSSEEWARTLVLLGFLFIHFIAPGWKFGSLYMGKATAADRAALPIPTSVCSVFVCPNNGMAASVRDLTSA